MMEKVLSRSIRLICLGGVALGVQSAYAQDAQPQQNAPARVEVTGSRIRQVDLETAQPIQVITQEQIQKSGLVTVGDILNQLSSAGSPDFSRGGALTSNRESGGQYINLRNLGSNRLLVLVDGKRWTQTVDGYTDMSTIPSSMIERMDVLKDGASSIYGSDAIAGVVNIILKKRLEGAQLSLYTGANDKGDGRSKDFSLSYGANSEKASLMFGISHTEQGVVWASKRDVTRFPQGPNHPNAGYGAGPFAEVWSLNDTFDYTINHTGDQFNPGVGADPRNPANYHNWSNSILADKFNSTGQMMFQIPNKLDTIFTKGTIELPYDMTLSSTVMYSQRKSSAQVAGYPLNSYTQSSFPVFISKDSYWNPFGEDLAFSRRTVEVPRVTDNENRTFHADITLAGNFELRGLAWNWDIGYNHSALRGSTLGTGNLNLPNLQRALGPSFMNASGVVQCGTADNPISLAECQPWNIISGPSASNPDILKYVMATGQTTYGSTIDSATANIGGELLQLPAGALGVAAGLEHRSVKGYDLPDQFAQSGYSTDLAGNPTRGKYSVREAYAEVNIPVLKGVPLAELLSFDLATRYSDYSNFGNTTNSKASFMWKPTKDILTRGTYAQGFRAPTLGDTFGGGQQSFDYYMDPCDSAFGQRGTAGVEARCVAAGALPGFRQLDQTKTPVGDSSGGQSPVPFMSGAGNASLQPEKAKTKTIGVVWSPSFLPGFSGSLDWFNIKVDNLISGISATDTAENCYVKGIQSFCDAIKRDPATGQIIALAHGNANLGAIETEGLDLSLGYRLPRTAYGQFSVRSDTSYVSKFREQADVGAEWEDYAGQYYYHRVKSNLSLDWTMGNWAATWTAHYFSPVKDRCYTKTDTCSDPNGIATWGTGYNKLGAMVYHDVSASYKFPWKGQLLVGANNFFDKKPRFTISGKASSSYVDADLPIDRFIYVRYNQAF
ncbi:TonB-dependent receptor plug domain-containing protein [Massilia norwichensis]|uniref:TonB-dependent receptor n=1 Tax=Massilia norwichensis TaxID=1442366 RepID=A0ABT2ACS0_9BURK|nr:TonB-dependent receptor [Massilia norwichensis]MCS0592014.1 TonB-dependent receptor [Massilia norwichensis]